MLFGLKNVGATYQMTMKTIFHDPMHKEIELYVVSEFEEVSSLLESKQMHLWCSIREIVRFHCQLKRD